jgi:hypothetical protein
VPVLERHRYALEEALVLLPAQGPIRRASLFPRSVDIERDDGVQRVVAVLDPLELSLERIGCTHAPSLQSSPEKPRRELEESTVHLPQSQAFLEAIGEVLSAQVGQVMGEPPASH